MLYNPTVVHADGRYRMWYVGSDLGSREGGEQIGLAESDDGIDWRAYPGNPVIGHEQLTFGSGYQTPHVVYDPQGGGYHMWFVQARAERDEHGKTISYSQKLSYAHSDDGMQWEIHSQPLYPSARGPCVLKSADGGWLMWMNSAPQHDGPFEDLVGHIYRFTSEDGLTWQRDAQPAVRAAHPLITVVYPCVLSANHGYIMWYGAHVSDGVFEVYCSTSADGIEWTHHHEQPAFGATRQHCDFDGRYTSTPCVVAEDNRWLMYYSARSWDKLYVKGNGQLDCDKMGIYQHIGLATADRSPADT